MLNLTSVLKGQQFQNVFLDINVSMSWYKEVNYITLSAENWINQSLEAFEVAKLKSVFTTKISSKIMTQLWQTVLQVSKLN